MTDDVVTPDDIRAAIAGIEGTLPLPPSPLRWRLWWRFGFGPLVRLIERVPVAEWRREMWVWRLDIWAMDNIGRRNRA